MFQTSKKIGIGFALLVGFFLGNPTQVEAAVDDDGHYREKIDLTEYKDADVLIHVDGGTLVGVNNWYETSDGTNGYYEKDNGSFLTSSHYYPSEFYNTHDYELIIDAPNSAYSVEVSDGASQDTAYDFTDVAIKNGNALMTNLIGNRKTETHVTFTLEKGREYGLELSSYQAFKLLSPDGSIIKAYDKESSTQKLRNGDVFFTYTPKTTGTYTFVNDVRYAMKWFKLLVYEVFEPEALSEMEPLVMNDGSADELLGLRYYGIKVDKKKPYILSPKWQYDAGYYLSLSIDQLTPTDSPDNGYHDAYDRKYTFGKSFAESGESQPQAFYSGDGDVQLHRHEWSKDKSKVTVDINASSFTAKSGDAAKAYVEVLNAENREASLVADPVDAFAGNFVDNRELLSYSGNNPLAFQLRYDSIANSSASLRGGFVHNYETYLKETDNGLSVYWSPNSVVHFDLVDGQYKPVHAKQSEVSVAKSGTGFTVTDANKQVFTFDLEGKLLKKMDKVGQQTDYTYTNGLLTSVENSKGQFFTFKYTSDGKLVSVEDAMKRTLNFRYENELLVGITTPNGTELKASYVASPSSALPFKVSELTYDNVTLVKNQYDEHGRVLKQWDGKKVLTNFTYDEFSNDEQVVTTITTGSRKEVLTHDRLGNVLKKTDGERFFESHTYDANRNQLSTVDKNGHQYEYAYDAKNRLVLTKNPDNTTVAYEYGEDNNITKITMPDGKTVKNTYENGRLIESTDRAGNKTSYTYDTFGNATRIKRDGHDVNYAYDAATGYLTGVSTNDGSVTQFENDVLGRVVKTILPDETVNETVYDADNNIVKTTDQKGQQSEFAYNAFGNVLTEKDPKGVVTTHQYDANGNRIRSKIGEREVGYDYNDFGELIKAAYMVNGRAKTTIQTSTYNNRGDLTKSENADKVSTIMTYDGNGHRLTETIGDSVTTYTYDMMGNNTAVTDSYGNQTAFTYDTVGNVLSETTPSGSMLTHQYDDMNRLTIATDALGHQTNYTYDPRGNVVRVTDANGTITTYEYNDNNQQTAEINALGERQTRTYNALGQLVAVKNNRDELVLSYEYDALGLVSKTTDGNGHTNTFTYDANGNRLTFTDGAGHVSETVSYNTYDDVSETTDALGNRTAHEYDTIGQLSKETDPNGNTTVYQHSATSRLNALTDASGKDFRYTYDNYGLLATTQYSYTKTQEFARDLNQNITSERFNGNTLSYEYNTDNELVKKTNGRKQALNYDYDENGRLVKETTVDGVTTYEYDAVGNPLVVESETARIERTYDVLGRVTSKTQDGQTIKYDYDDRGDLVRMDYPTGESVDYTYDVMGNLLTVTDWNGRKTEYAYNENNQLIKTTHANGTEELRTYDANGQVLTLVNKKRSNVISRYAYEYDANGNIVNENDLVLKYDGLNRLTQSGDNTYKYNPTGDITDFTTVQADGSSYKQTMQYNDASALTRLNYARTSVDTDGNLTDYKLNNEQHHAVYNSSNQLVSFDDVTYKYDGERNRIGLTDDGTEIAFVVDNDSHEHSRVLIEETNGESIYHVYGHGLIGSYSVDGAFETHHYDYRGSTTGMTDESGSVLGTVSYDEYGVITHQDETVTTRFLYNGLYGVQTDQNGLYYMRARFYNPDLKRFMNRDVVMGSITEPQTLNRYAFVNGNPISYHDPFGLARETLMNSIASMMPMIHTILDFAGMVPILGMVPDAINASLYLSKGDFTNAAWSSMAIIPFLGEAATGAKYANRAIDGISFASKHADTIADGAKLAGKYGDDVAKLGAKGYNKARKSNGLLPMDLQTFAKKKRVPVKVDPYQRPSGFRSGVRETVLENAKDANGKIRDPLTDSIIDPKKPWDMGHKPGYEFRKHRESAKRRGINRKQFLDEHNDPTHYQPELPSSNRSHLFESKNDDYFGY